MRSTQPLPRAAGAPRGARAAFSLLEVILALAILCGAIATLGELSRLGMRQAQRARDLSQAQLLCESKLAEIASGLTPAEAVDSVPFESTDEQQFDESEWAYSVEVTPIDEEGLTAVRVTVTRDELSGLRAAEFSLVRWIVNQSEPL